jgi:hypothetical protein
VGRSLDDLINSRGVFRDPQFAELRDAPVGDWAVGVVQEEFWGLPFWTPRLVLLTNYIYWKNEDYFVDGSRGRGLLTRYLPIVGGGINCSRTKPAQDALVDLRALREASFNSGTHLLGYVREPQTFARGLARPTPSKFAPGVRISVTGPSGTEIVTTDQTGIYRVDDLPPGDYTLQLLIPDDKTAGFWRNDGSPATISIAGHGLVERNFDLFWNGRIEGHVADDSGEPVQGWVKLLSPDGVQSPPYVKDALAAPDGSYQIKNIPPGRYKVMVDSSGVEYRFPPEIQYYPAKLPAEDAQVFELQQGQQIKGIDFKVRHLTQRTVRVRVTSPSGSALRDAFICVAYEHTQYFEPLEAKQCPKATEQDGVAVIHVYGKSRVRVFANQTIYNNQSKSFDEHHSHPVESEANAMPAKIDLVLDAPTP